MTRIANYRRSTLALALVAALAMPPGVAHAASNPSAPHDKLAAQAQETVQSSSTESSKPDDSNPAKLKKVVVLGSMIPRVEIEGARPVMKITAKQMKVRGFNTLWEFMDSLPQVGRTVTPPTWGATATNARQLNLRNMGSQFSLLMINGNRMVDYPYPHFGQTNFQNLNNIPTGMIKSVQILGSGASSLYGSDAVAGVMNVILKKHYKGDKIDVTLGGATRGGRRYADINFVGGRSGENWHIVYNLEHTNRQALWGRDRPYTDSEADAGYGAWGPSDRIYGYHTSNALALEGPERNYVVAPPPNSCESFPNFQRRQYLTANVKGNKVLPGYVDHGQYCAQHDVFRNWVLTPGLQSNDAFVSGGYDINDDLTVYGSAALWATNGWSNTTLIGAGPTQGLPVPFYDRGSGQIIASYSRQLTRAEIGGMGNTHNREQYWTLRAGIKGSFDDHKFHWNLGIGDQKYIVHKYYTGSNAKGMFHFFFGPKLGTKTVDGKSYPVYDVNEKRFWHPITPAQYRSFAVHGENTAWSWMQNVTFRINGSLFRLPWDDRPVGWATVVEAYHNGYQLAPDPRGNTLSFSDPFGSYNTGGGIRNRYSIGTELRLPLLSSLDVDLSGRVDKYDDASIANISRTWGIGIEWRPFSNLLLRGSYGTNFRAPDMQAIYETASTRPIGVYRDYLKCIQAKNFNCQAYQHAKYFTQYSGGNPNLLPESGQSWTYGFVWDVPWVDNLSVSADYWHIGVNNSIVWISQDQLMQDEAGCITGLTIDGGKYTDHVPGSDYCRLAIKDVVRDADGDIKAIHVGPINQASLYVTGIDASLKYHVHTAAWGNFRVTVNYTDNLSRHAKTLPSDPTINTRYQNVASKVTGVVQWSRGPWNASISGVRFGKLRANGYGGCEALPNGIRPAANDPACVDFYGTLPPLIRWNGSVGYHFTKRFGVRLTIHNIFNRVGQIPYYAGGFEFIPRQQGANYNGREVFLRIDYKID